ncbi:unnamed protein product [Lathyrus oleraceus]
MNGGNGSLNIKLQVFDGKNWNRWSIQMCVLFGAQGVLDLVSNGYVPVATEGRRNTQRETRTKDQNALFYIHHCVEANMFEKIVDSTIVKAVWDTLVRCYAVMHK